jgi:hypothetical protein
MTDIEKLRKIVESNYDKIRQADGDQSQAVGLRAIESNGQEIYDVFVDETMMDEVNPFEYYGHSKLKTMIEEETK